MSIYTNNPIPPGVSGVITSYKEAIYKTLSDKSYYFRLSPEYTTSEEGFSTYDEWILYPYGQSGVQGWSALDLFRGIESPILENDDPNILTDTISAYRQTYSYTDNYSGEIRIYRDNGNYTVISGFNDYISINPSHSNTFLRKYPQYNDIGSLTYLNSAAYTQICYDAEFWKNHGGNYSGHISTLQLNPIYLRFYDYTSSGQFTYSVSCPLPYPFQIPSGWSFTGNVPTKYIPSGGDIRDVVNTPAYFTDPYANDIFVQCVEFYSGMLANPKIGPFHPSWPSLATLTITNPYYGFNDNNGIISLYGGFDVYYPDYNYLKQSGIYSDNIPRPAIGLSGNMRLHNIDRDLSIDKFYTEDQFLSLTSGIPIHIGAGPQWYFFQQCQNPHWFIRNIHSKTELNTFIGVPLDLPETGVYCFPKTVDFTSQTPIIDLILTEINFGNTGSGKIKVEIDANLNHYELIGKQRHTNGAEGPPIIFDVVPYFTLALKEKGGLFNDVGHQYRTVITSGIDITKSGPQIIEFEPGVPQRSLLYDELPTNTPFNKTETLKITRNPYAGYELKIQNYWKANYNCEKSEPLLKQFDSLEFFWSPAISGIQVSEISNVGTDYFGHQISSNPHLKCDIDLKLNDIVVPILDIPGSAVLKTPVPARIGTGWKIANWTVVINILGSIKGKYLWATYFDGSQPPVQTPYNWYVSDYIDIRIDPYCGRSSNPFQATAIIDEGITTRGPLLVAAGFENEAKILDVICISCSNPAGNENHENDYCQLMVNTDEKTTQKNMLYATGIYSMLCGKTIYGQITAHVPDFIVKANPLDNGEQVVVTDINQVSGWDTICEKIGRTLTINLDYAEIIVTKTYDTCHSQETVTETKLITLGQEFTLGDQEKAEFTLDMPCGMAEAWF